MESVESHVSKKRVAAPGPRSWPLLGNVGLVRGLLPFMESQWREHGDVVRLRLMGMSTLLVSHPDHIQHVLIGNRKNYYKGPAYDGVRRMIGDNLVTLEGEAWKERRTLAQPTFHRASLEKLSLTMVESGVRFFDQLDAQLTAGPQILDVQQEMVKLTLDVVINAMFGRGTLETSEVSYQALGETMELVSQGANGIQLPAWVPTPKNLKFHRTMRALDAHVYKIIDAARARDQDGTLLSMLLAIRDEQGNPLSNEVLRAEVLTLFLAGHETTALTLSWLFVVLEHEPEVFARMHEEVDSVLGGREPSFADLPRLSYVRQVLDETLRVRPPVAMVARNAVSRDELGGFHVEEGDTIMPFFWGAHRHPDFWHEPERFRPERFSAAESKGRHPCSYLPFSVGPRICIGNSFTLIETTLLIAQMLNRFAMEVQPCSDVRPVAVGTVRPSKPVRVMFSRRRRD